MSSSPSSSATTSKTGLNAFTTMKVFLAIHLLVNVWLLVASRHKPLLDKPLLAILSTLIILTIAVLLLVGRYASRPSNWLRFRWPCLGLLVLHLVLSIIFSKTFGDEDDKLFAVISCLDIFISLICFGFTLLFGLA